LLREQILGNLKKATCIDMTDWLYKGDVFLSPGEEHYGFVYIITHTLTGKQYIGKKLFWHKKTKTLKGKKKRYLAESDWKTYYGSSKELNEEIKNSSIDHYKRDILHLCKSKSECSYYEAKEQFDRDVLLKPEMYYNDWISVKVTRKHLINESRSGKTVQTA